MLFQRFPLFLYLLLIGISVKSQTNYIPGYIITNNDDTINGLIDYRGAVRNAKNCSFKQDKKSEIITYKPFEIKAYRFNNSKYFISKKIENPNDPGKEIFLEYLVNGISDLYYFRDLSGDHFYISKNDGQLFELSNEMKKTIVDGREYLKNTNDYIRFLQILYDDCDEIRNDIDQAELNPKSLIRLTKEYHNYMCDDEECIVYEKKLPVTRITISPFVGYGRSTLKMGKNIIYSKADISQANSIPVGVTVSVSMPDFSEKLSLQVTTQLSKQDYEGFIETKYVTGTLNDYLHIHLIKPDLTGSLKYSFPTGKIRPTFAIGVGHSFVFSSKSTRIQESIWNNSVTTQEYKDIPIPSGLTLFTGSVGIDVKLFKNQLLFFDAFITRESGYNHNTKSILKTFGIKLGTYF